MAGKRRVNWLSQQRVDVPDMRSVESAVSNDFDELFKAFATGTVTGYVIRGFEISMTGAIGAAANSLQMIVDPGAILHINSSQSGTFYLVPSGTSSQQLNSATNTIVDGAFSPSSINYVGLEYERFVDDTTSAQVYLWNPTTKSETTKNAPRAQILRYRIKISSTQPDATVLPIAKVTTDAGNNVTLIEDCRDEFNRLGTGGWNPNPFYEYPWTAHSEGRLENPNSSSSNGVSPFRGGDKMLGSLKEWMNALMTAIKEIKGTTYWYSENTSGSLESLRQDLGNTIMTGRGSISHDKTTAGKINWDEDIIIRVVGSQLSYTLEANPSSSNLTLDEEEVAYVNLVRGVAVVPNLIFTNGSAIVTSVGAVAWTANLVAGDFVKLAADGTEGYYQISSVDSSSQVTLTVNYAGTSTGAPGAKAEYAYGVYQAVLSPTTDRHIHIADRDAVPVGENMFWLMLRSDNSGSTPRVYVRFLGAEIQQGETEQISDTTSQEILEYIGSESESDDYPDYVKALNPSAVPEITDLTFGSAATIAQNDYFFINSSGDYRTYFVWFNKDGGGTEPAPANRNAAVEVAITTGMTAIQVAAAVAAALSATTDDDFDAVQRVSPNDHIVRVTNTSSGACQDAVDFNMGAPFAVTIIQQGVGTGNRTIDDGDNLTLSIKKLDVSLAEVAAALDSPGYDETLPINSNTSAGSILTLPLNSRLSNIQQKYTVGKGTLQLCLGGIRLEYGIHFQEVGAQGTASSQVQTLIDLVVGDRIKFELIAVGGPGTGSGGVGPAGPPGAVGPPGADAAGGPIAISTKTANYSVLLGDNVLLGDASSGNVVFTLPSAASATGRIFYFKKIDATVNSVSIQTQFGQLIDGLTSVSTSTQYESFTIVCDGTNFWIL